MPDAITDNAIALRSRWTDHYVRVSADYPEGKRFIGRVGRVITINASGKAIVDFADGAWYDLPPDMLVQVPDEDAKSKYDGTANSASAHPARKA